ncbi:MAG: anti-sigma factor [Deltaproteobacteria bacterium]|nr:anti-sigma factor [Deltaproteobacteria bacterium]
MIKHDQIHDLLPAYALGSLDKEEAIRVSEHLATCAKCNEQFLEYRSTVGAMAYGTPGISPPNSLKQKLMQRIQSTADIQSAIQPASKRWKLRSLWPNFSPAWAFASLALIISLSVTNFMQWNNTQTLQGEVAVDLLVLKMKGTYRAPKGDGTFVISQDRKKGVLVASDLPIPDGNQQYQLWMKKDDQHVSGGVFSVTPTGYAVVEIQSKESLSNFRSFEITLEPAGGSLTQTGNLYMISHL